MSWIETAVPCVSPCQAIVGSAFLSTQGTTTFIWDEDIHVLDSDGDGLSNTLENVIGTSPYVQDTDGDGLTDGEEVFGLDVAQNKLRLPYFGADPLVKDAFIEADWLLCSPGSCSNGINAWQLAGATPWAWPRSTRQT
jgi:hypothetical protein